MRSERWMTPGTYSRPAEPMPFTRPNLAPLALTHSGPLGPSITCGMRSLSAAEAFLVKRSGGSQIRSTWPSAEMTSYFMGAILRRRSSPRRPRPPTPYAWTADRSAIHPRPVAGWRGEQDRDRRQRQDQAHRQDGLAARGKADIEIAERQGSDQRAARAVHPGVGYMTEAPLAQKVDHGDDRRQAGHHQARAQQPYGDRGEVTGLVLGEDAGLRIEQVAAKCGEEIADDEGTEQRMKRAAGDLGRD